MTSARETVLEMVSTIKPQSYVEVGCWMGTLTRQVKELVPDVWCIDPHEQVFNEFDKYTCRMGAQGPVSQDELNAIAEELYKDFGNRYLRMTSIQASEYFEDESLDFVYIDAIHDYEHVKEDIKVWLPKVKKGGVLCGDDYKPKRFPGLCEGVREMLPNCSVNGVVWSIKK